MTAKVLGASLGIGRGVGAVAFAVVIGLLMATICGWLYGLLVV